MDAASPVDARQARGLALVRAQRAKIKHVASWRWLVPSQTNASGGYVVDVEQNACTCPDHEDRGLRCKHIWAVMILRSEVSLPNGTTIVTEKRVTYSQPDWSAYHRAQCDEKHRVQLLLRGLCDGIAQPEQTNGRPRLPLADAVYGMTMKVYTGMSGRRATTDIRECEDKGLVAKAPSYNSVFRYMEREDICYDSAMARPRPAKISSLPGSRWKVPGLGEVTITTGSPDVAARIDKLWRERRGDIDALLAWKWVDIVADMREAFAIHAAGSPIAIWASKPGSCVQLDGKPYYRLDYLEVDPERRGDGQTSTLLAGMIAKRATEHRASGIVLPAFPSEKLAKFYESLGATRGAPQGLEPPPQLVPFTFGQDALDNLRELVDALQKDPGRAIP
jgi:GNAT superfamily N-acetyltransferase